MCSQALADVTNGRTWEYQDGSRTFRVYACARARTHAHTHRPAHLYMAVFTSECQIPASQIIKSTHKSNYNEHE